MTEPAAIPPQALTDAACPFCDRIKTGEFDYEDVYSVAFQPLNPVTPGHFLVVSRQHVASALGRPAQAGSALSFAVRLAGDMGLDACNFITSAGAAATQTVRHLHIHIVPRREGDGLALPWNPKAAAPHLAAAHGHGPHVAVDPGCAACQQIDGAAAAERERCAQLAERVSAQYDIDGGYGQPFAALLREDQP